MNLIEKVFGTHSERELKLIRPIVDKILGMREQMTALSDDELRDNTRKFKERLANGETLDDLLPEAFATVREAARRVLNMEHYPVQLIGGIVLHQGRIAEMRTGEGKTLVSTAPAYLNALAGKGVFIVTVNDYLAKRDAEWMGEVHRFLGLTVGVVLNSMNSDERREAYNCDITYVTNNELGFDYLRDNMVIYKEQMVMRNLDYAIIDEVDSVLIDEARTPLIISGQSGKSTKLYEVCDILARQLEKGEESAEFSKMAAIMGEEIEETGDFVVNEKDKVVNLTEAGVKKVEDFFHIENLADPENLEIQHNIILALRANYLMFRDKDYVVKDDEVLIVDEFTGRIMPGRRYSDGLHQAIEAKEHVHVRRESRTLATITFQNFFNKFNKKAGMTGTAQTEEKEFRNIYQMDVISIPTNRPVQRIDYEDAVYKTKKANQKAKLLYLQQILLEETDEKHVLTLQQLIERLAELEIPAERKSLYDDIATLQAFGLDVIATRSRANIYRIGSRLFTLSELQLLAEAVVKSSAITQNKAQKLVDKLARLASRYQAETLRENLKAQKYDDAELLCPVELRCSNEIVPVVLEYLADSKVTKSKAVFPSDDSLLKMLYLATMDITKKWTGHRQDWGQIHSQLEIYFEERLAGRNL